MKDWRRRTAWLVPFVALMVFCAVLALAEQEKRFVGNKSSKKYHVTECRWAQKMKPENRVPFNSAQEAEKAGYAACKVCKPAGKK